jgi:hypothetical protein
LVILAMVFGTQAKRLREAVDLTRDLAGRQERVMRTGAAAGEPPVATQAPPEPPRRL